MLVLTFGVIASLLAVVVRAPTLAFVVQKARLLTSCFLGRQTLGSTGVHHIHDLLIAKSQMHRLAWKNDMGTSFIKSVG